MTTVINSSSAIANNLALIVDSSFETYTPLAPIIFNDVTPTRHDEKFTVISSEGDIPEVGEDDIFPGADISEAGTKTLTQASYKRKYALSQLMKRFDTEAKMMKHMAGVGRKAGIKMDRLCADVLNGGFDTETVWSGDFLFGATQAIGSTGLTQSNLVAGALTDSTLNDAVVALRNLKDHDNLEDPTSPRWLVVPTALEKKAKELVHQGLDPESANHTHNTHGDRGIKVVVWELLTSSTAWFLLTDKMFHELNKLVARDFKVVTRDGIYTDTGSDEIRVDFAMKAGAVDYRGTTGSTGL